MKTWPLERTEDLGGTLESHDWADVLRDKIQVQPLPTGNGIGKRHVSPRKNQLFS